jgi:hypothetical protein
MLVLSCYCIQEHLNQNFAWLVCHLEFAWLFGLSLIPLHVVPRSVSFIFLRLHRDNASGNICYHLHAAPNIFPNSVTLQKRQYLWLSTFCNDIRGCWPERRRWAYLVVRRTASRDGVKPSHLLVSVELSAHWNPQRTVLFVLQIVFPHITSTRLANGSVHYIQQKSLFVLCRC